MRWSVLLTVAICSLFVVAVASAQSPVLSPSPTALASPSVSPTPPPSTTATATPPSGPIYKGRPCGVGRLIHDFLIVQEPPPGPVATCLEPVTSTAPERLYHLRSVPAGLRFEGVARDAGQGLVYVLYTSLADPEGSPVLQIILSRGYQDPTPLVLRDASVATAANFLPVPGIALRDDPVLRNALWHEAAGLYWIMIDPRRTSLTLEEVAALLEPFVPTPVPPPTGTGQPVDKPRGSELGFVAASVVLALSLTVGSAALLLRRRE